MTGAGIVRVILDAAVIAIWVLPDARRIADVTRPDAPFPFLYAGFGILSVFWIVGDVRSGDWLQVTVDTTVTVMCVRVIWSWWRRRRQGKPSRVLGLVQDVGHKLAVVNVPAGEGT